MRVLTGAVVRLGAIVFGLLAALAGPGAALAQDVVPPKAYSLTPGGINASDGNFVYSEIDLSMGPLTLERYHRGGARQPNNPMFGTNFSSNFDIYLSSRYQGGSNFLIVHIGNSASGQYTQWVAQPTQFGADNIDAYKGVLSWNGTQYVYVDSTGTIYTFSATITAAGLPFAGQSRRVERIDFPDGRRQTFTYATVSTGVSQPRVVEDSSGYAILFDYVAGEVWAACIFKRSEAFIDATSTCASAQLKTSYGYTSGRLTSAVDVLNRTTAYTNTFRGVTCVTPPDYSSCKFSQSGGPFYDAISFGNTQVLADGGSWRVSGQDWDAVPRGDEGAPAPGDGHVEVYVCLLVADVCDETTDTELTFTKSSPYTITDPLGRVTRFKFFGGQTLSGGGQWGTAYYGSMLIEATYPEGDIYQADYAGPFSTVSAERHIPKPGSLLPTLTKTYGYNYSGTYQNAAKPIWIQDPNGNRTEYSYASHGGILTEMSPAPVANGARPLKVTTWVTRSAWTLNSPSGPLAQGPAIHVKNTETVCQTVAGANPATTCNGEAPQIVTTYEYGANGTGQSLLVKGVVVTADGTSLRTCYGYDQFDRRISETQPNGTVSLTSCP